MEDYYKMISAKILDGYDDIIEKVPQPQMLGGKRMRNFVLPGSTEYDYPGTLSVGRHDNQSQKTLGEEFYNDFGEGHPTGSLKGASRHSLERKVGGKFDLGKTLKSVGKVVAPVAKELAKEGIKEGIKSYAKGGAKFNLGKTLKSVGKVLKPAGKALAKTSKEVYDEILVPEGKKALKEYIRSGLKPSPETTAGMRKPRGRPRKVLGADPRTFTPPHLLADGGALIRNAPKQFHSSVYPPALASYNHDLPIESRGSGRLGEKVKINGGARAARGAIVKEIMKKHGMSLPEASKFVKEKGLY